ncbi:MAG TPA: pyridoxamine 5'-phosphate oxidase family protein [Candidatus Paceibacterota bacterium]
MDASEKAKEIIEKIIYITIATASKEAEPWNTPVLAAYDEQYNFYWTSMANTQHSQNIRVNPKVYLSIFDSTVKPGEAGGVYVKASAVELSDPAEIERAVALVYKRKNKPIKMVEEFLGESPKRIYKAIPEKFWINLDVDIKNNPLDPKKEITLP